MTNEIKDPRMNDHMANERTFLAWIRTSLGIIAFGFVIERFGLFIRQMGLILGKAGLQTPAISHGVSEIVGVFVVGFGTLLCLLAYINFKKAEKHIIESTSIYLPSGSIYMILISAIVTLGVCLVIYLMQNLNPGARL